MPRYCGLTVFGKISAANREDRGLARCKAEDDLESKSRFVYASSAEAEARAMRSAEVKSVVAAGLCYISHAFRASMQLCRPSNLV